MKTLALIDLIGIKGRFADGTAAEKLPQFWERADAWTNTQSIEYCSSVEKRNTQIVPQAIVTAWSDSLLLYSDPEIQLQDFFEKMLFPLKGVAERVDKAYAVVCRGEALDAPRGAAVGGRIERHGGGNAWNQVFGSGPAWVNLWLADKFIAGKSAWHGSYTLYAVGNDSLCSSIEVKEKSEMRGMGGATIPVYAVERKAAAPRAA